MERVGARDVRDRDADAAAVADHQPRPAGRHQLVDRPGHARGEGLPRLAGRRLARPAAPVGQLVARRVDLGGHATAPLADVDLAPALVEPRRAQAQQLGGLARAAEVAAHHAVVGRARRAWRRARATARARGRRAAGRAGPAGAPRRSRWTRRGGRGSGGREIASPAACSRKSSSPIAVRSPSASSARSTSSGSPSVAVYSEADREAQHVKRAGEAYLLGPGPAAESYLNVDKLLEVIEQSGAEAVHPGYGFLAENAAFAQRLEEAGVTFIGPPASAIEAMGSKTRARELMKEAGVPIVPGTTEPVERRRGRAQDRRGHRLPDRGQGRGRRRRQGLPRRARARQARGRVRGRRARGREVLQRRDRLPRALPAGPAPRRGPGAGRQARQRRPPRRARLLDPAPPPEADRGVARAAGRRRAAGQDRRDRGRGRARRRLPLGGHDRGPAAGRRVLLPGDEHARAGRALRDRGDHRRGHRARADPDRGRRGAQPSARTTSAGTATRSSAASTPRTRRRTSRPRRAR